MRKLLLLGALAVGLTGLSCEISIKADGPAVFGEPLTITVEVVQIHRRCVTPIEDTRIDLPGLSVVDYTPWQEVEPGLRRLELTVVPVWVGKVGIEVRRDCVKYGTMEETLYLDAALSLKVARKLVPQAEELSFENGIYRALAADGTLLAELRIVKGSVKDAGFQLLLATSPEGRILDVLFLTPWDVPTEAMEAYLSQFAGLELAALGSFEPRPMPDQAELSAAILAALRGTAGQG
ncbi:hypothetical protein ACVNPS_06830 [Candidatus Bipolaricaulota sp. J31]